jgi:hypothetical protein
MGDFFDAEGIEDAEAMDIVGDIEAGYHDMSEAEAFDAFDLAISLGFGEEIGLEEAEYIRAQNEERKLARDDVNHEEHVRSLRSGHIQTPTTKTDTSKFSKVTGKHKCPFEQWMKDIVSGRKTIKDPMKINIFDEEF